MRNFVKISFVLTVLCLLSLPLRAEEFTAQKPPFKVSVSPDQTLVKSGMMFLVRVQVVPPGDASFDMWCHSCSYEKHWITDTDGVFIQSWTCSEDHLEHVVLDGGETYEKNIILYVRKDSSGPVTFRLGFKQLMENGDEMEPVWSDPITMRVRVPEGQASSQEIQGPPPQDKTRAIEISDTVPDETSEPDGDTRPNP